MDFTFHEVHVLILAQTEADYFAHAWQIHTVTYGHTHTHENARVITMASHCAEKHTTTPVKWEKVRGKEGRLFVCMLCHDVSLRPKQNL